MDQLQLQSKILLYLDKKLMLSEMNASCINYLEELREKSGSKFLSFRYLLEVDVMDLLDMSPDLGEALIKEPMRWEKICSEILFACLQSIHEPSEMNENVLPAQVAVNLRLKCVFNLLVPTNSRIYNGLTTFQGLLLSVSKPSSYVYHSVWSCPEECEGNEVILHYIPKVPPKCYVCRSVLFENSGLRRCGEKVTTTFKIKNNMLPKSFNIVDDLIPELKCGAKYILHVVANKNVFKVMSLEQVHLLKSPATVHIPEEIEDLFKACKGIPWQFIYCLASSIGVNICPLNCFMHLKIYMLLSLTSIKANILTGATIVHVLAAGYDTGYVAKLMQDAGMLADNAVFQGTSNNSPSSALIASAGGVCVMALPLHAYNHKQISGVLTSIETGEIATETDKVKLRSAVWAQGMDFKKLNLQNIASIFGTVCRGDTGEYNDEIVDHVLQNAVERPEKTKEEVRASRDIVKYVDLVSGINVDIDEKTEELLRNYFLVARKEKPRNVSVGSLGALVACCMTSARLCRRSIATVDDAVFSIWLHVSGTPEPRFAPEEYLQTPADVKTLQKVMNSFKDWLGQFTGTYIT